MLPTGRYWSAGFSAERPSPLRQVASHDGKEMEALGGLFAAVLKCALTKGFAGQYVAVDKSLGWLHQGPTVEQNLGEAVSVRGSRQRYPRFRVRSRPRVLPVPSRSPTTRDRGPTMRVPSVGWRPREPTPRLRCWEVRNERAAMIRPLPRRCRGSAHPAPRAVEMQIPLGSGSLLQATCQGCQSFTQKSAEKCGSDPKGARTASTSSAPQREGSCIQRVQRCAPKAASISMGSPRHSKRPEASHQGRRGTGMPDRFSLLRRGGG